ncbi:hypothetical protein HA402_005634 [Bradysia odoriphaga]|nr:hypothetical protein HA402_005634 [Bradysia odoriphaga]
MNGSQVQQDNQDKPVIESRAWLSYILDNYATVDEAVKAIRSDVRLAAAHMPIDYASDTKHIAIEDVSGDSAIIEIDNGKVNIYHDKNYRVMTNPPSYDKQLQNLAKYQNAKRSEIPGGLEADERLVRASYDLKNLPQPDNKNQAQGFILSVLNNVAYPIGSPAEPSEQQVTDMYAKYSKRPDQNKGIGTYWTAIADLSHAEYHFKSAFAASQVWVPLHDINFSQGQPVRKIAHLNDYAQQGWEALVVIVVLALLVSNDRKKIRPRYIIQLLVIEAALAYFFLHSASGLGVIKHVADFFAILLAFAAQGSDFVFGGMSNQGLAFIFLGVLCPIIFISALIGILQHFRILPLVIPRLNGMGKLESFNAVSTLVLGQSENFIAYKGIIADISPRRMYTMAATAMSTVSMSIVGAYMAMIDAQYVVAALILNMFSTFIILSIINPYQVDDEPELKLNKLHEEQSFFEMLGEYILAGFKIAMIIAAMLIGFIALIAAVNAIFAAIFAAIFGISFQQILGYVFYPLAWLIGIPAPDALRAGSIMATKLVANEFVAMIELKKIATELSPRGLGILSVFLVSFANFASIGIVAGAIKGLNERQGQRGFPLWPEAGLRLHAGQPAFGGGCRAGVSKFFVIYFYRFYK